MHHFSEKKNYIYYYRYKYRAIWFFNEKKPESFNCIIFPMVGNYIYNNYLFKSFLIENSQIHFWLKWSCLVLAWILLHFHVTPHSSGGVQFVTASLSRPKISHRAHCPYRLSWKRQYRRDNNMTTGYLIMFYEHYVELDQWIFELEFSLLVLKDTVVFLYFV